LDRDVSLTVGAVVATLARRAARPVVSDVVLAWFGEDTFGRFRASVAMLEAQRRGLIKVSPSDRSFWLIEVTQSGLVEGMEILSEAVDDLLPDVPLEEWSE